MNMSIPIGTILINTNEYVSLINENHELKTKLTNNNKSMADYQELSNVINQLKKENKMLRDRLDMFEINVKKIQDNEINLKNNIKKREEEIEKEYNKFIVMDLCDAEQLEQKINNHICVWNNNPKLNILVNKGLINKYMIKDIIFYGNNQSFFDFINYKNLIEKFLVIEISKNNEDADTLEKVLIKMFLRGYYPWNAQTRKIEKNIYSKMKYKINKHVD
jgi:hypothetical protein